MAPPAAGAQVPVAPKPQVNAACTLLVPPDPLSAQGLATPYQLTATDQGAGPCNEANADRSAFVQGAIVAPGGQLTLYNPLVIDQGTQPAAQPVPATVPPGSTVGIWFGFNGDTLTLRSAGGGSVAQGRCVNGLDGSLFGQFAHCNAVAFFQAVNGAGAVQIPQLGTSKDGQPCPTVRDFSVVDQDQSDNVNTHYLATQDGRTAQPNAAGALGGQVRDLANGSDNRLLTEFILPTLGCTTLTAPDQSNGNTATASLPLQEIEAAARQQAPVALVPLNDPMTLVGDARSPAKTDLFRAGVDQPPLGGGDNGSPAAYCRGVFNDPHGIQRVFNAQAVYAAGRSPNADTGTNLFTFLASRASDAFGLLGCDAALNQKNPITLTTNGDGVVSAATFTPGGAKVAADAAAPAAAAGAAQAQAGAAPAQAGAAPAPAVDPAATPAV
ncbi:MAG TPA: hypothetical protein VHN80_19775, partial [Kineosporiaceae bacterium]|nr:hypothetical protein [Kineosporiaceae bacterium]